MEMSQEEKNKLFIDETMEAFLEKSLNLEAGSREKASEVDIAMKLYEARQKDRQMDLEAERIKLEREKLCSASKIDMKDILKYGFEGFVFISGVLVDIALFKAGMEFEEDHIFTSNILRNFFGKKLFKKR